MTHRDPWEAADEHALSHLLLRNYRAHAAVFIAPNGRIRGWNAGAEYITGFSAADVMGQPASMLFTPEDRERGLAEQELRIATEVGLAEDERWHVRRDGGRTWTSGVTMPLRDGDGQVTGFIKIFRDASHLRGRMKALENEVQECAARQARQQYFVSSIAHELRNPLAPLKNALQVLQRGAQPAPEEVRQPLRMMDRQLGFLERLVEDLVDLTRVQTGKLHLACSDVVLQQLVTDAVEIARQAPRAQTINLQTVLPAVPLHVEVDAERMLQVLGNLLNNAIKFTPAGGSIWVTVTADQTHFLVLVKDTGEGIRPELLTRVFDAFTQANETRTGRGDGVGLGLAVVKEIVTLHKGTVEVRSEGEGKGSEFIVRVPLRQPEGSGLEPLPRSP